MEKPDYWPEELKCGRCNSRLRSLPTDDDSAIYACPSCCDEKGKLKKRLIPNPRKREWTCKDIKEELEEIDKILTDIFWEFKKAKQFPVIIKYEYWPDGFEFGAVHKFYRKHVREQILSYLNAEIKYAGLSATDIYNPCQCFDDIDVWKITIDREISE